MRNKVLPIAVIALMLIASSSGCHRKRKKRSFYGGTYDVEWPKRTVKSFFPVCMRRQLSGYKSFAHRDWKGAVSFVLDHSDWYEQANILCQNDTVQCWINGLPAFISASSPALHAAQTCVKEYFDWFYEVRSKRPVYRTGLIVTNSRTCPVVKEDKYAREFVKMAKKDMKMTKSDDEDEILSDFSNVLEFVINDMICVDNPLPSFFMNGSATKHVPEQEYIGCSCNRLERTEDDDADYAFPDGESCGSCWTTRLAVSLRPESSHRRSANVVAKRRAGLTRKPRKPKIPKPERKPHAKPVYHVQGPFFPRRPPYWYYYHG